MTKFTPRQVEALQHRLEVPECIADGYEEVFDRDEIMDAAVRLSESLARDGAIDLISLSEVERTALRDCIVGSTWAAIAYDEGPAEWRGAVRVLENIVAKLEGAGISAGPVPVY